MPVGIAVVLLLAAPVVAHVLTSRLTPVIALPFAAFLLLIAAAPMNLGEGVTSLSFAMFYNRLGWVLLATLLVMALPPKRPAPRQLWPDALSAAFLVGTMLYLKISYGLVGLAFLAILLTAPAQRAIAALSLAITAAAILVVEAVWGSSAAHLADIALAGQVSGGLRSLEDLTAALLRHLGDYALFALVAGLAVRRTRSMRDVVLYAFCAASGLALLLQNSQPWGIVTLQAGASLPRLWSGGPRFLHPLPRQHRGRRPRPLPAAVAEPCLRPRFRQSLLGRPELRAAARRYVLAALGT
jgi:hypothetical protein